ncbi:MAG: undecaprenyl-diphosphate phosphatase [Brasilonema octagenarum HA4186-MV1]|jgi:undecaprenyl-diphosphatase|uniref:Undecaprenyl-diphosphatase n=2 Tax=Brasilonema TaxID=383614 RepID=A0A856MD12_9CYAN|nr:MULTISPECIES: undecaprenyl-diphosphate phosphatase [Brasilonema]MBW4628520.1 undecaprenyl-diphosphate phosphatase [Brasilonema octagenarum HA4186-MV1]NMF61517.1 undecaprenyl-diphosphatase [Brasilonema octagenarum UFV-OR1]QDL06927.1 undecaprenyl-diphosphatase [Brasilonema sennae CENA114]QDL13290.1 undecaprenyl-diphosphatase [Brasilonema octagenarum UFV-E1]
MLSLIVATTGCANGSEVNLDFTSLGWIDVIILGIVQGITELLPISSTAHMRIVPTLLGLQDPGSAFSAAMQLASLTAVLSYFWKDLKKLTGETFRAITGQDYQSSSFRLMVGLLLGTLPITIAGLLLKPILNACDSPMRGLVVIGAASIVMSLLLAIAEKRGERDRTFEKITLWDGIWVGVAQAFALIPGVSRSGSTLTAGLFLGMERETAAKFSFLLGLPAVILAGALELHTLFKAGLSGAGWLTLLIGLISASISAFVAIWGLLRYLEKHSTLIFIFYRFGMGIFLIVAVISGWLPN